MLRMTIDLALPEKGSINRNRNRRKNKIKKKIDISNLHCDAEGKILQPETVGSTLLTDLGQAIHLGSTKLSENSDQCMIYSD